MVRGERDDGHRRKFWLRLCTSAHWRDKIAGHECRKWTNDQLTMDPCAVTRLAPPHWRERRSNSPLSFNRLQEFESAVLEQLPEKRAALSAVSRSSFAEARNRNQRIRFKQVHTAEQRTVDHDSRPHFSETFVSLLHGAFRCCQALREVIAPALTIELQEHKGPTSSGFYDLGLTVHQAEVARTSTAG